MPDSHVDLLRRARLRRAQPSVPDRGRDRPRRDVRRLPRPRSPARARRRHQGPATRARPRSGRRVALHPRGADVGAALARPHRPDPRRRRARRHRVLRHVARLRRKSRAAPRATVPPLDRRGAPPAQRDLRRARLRASARRHPPRHQARQHPHRRRERARDGHRLRHRAGDGGWHAPDADRRRRGDADLHVPRAGGRRARDRRTERHLLARRRRLPDAHRARPVPGEQRDGAAAQARQRASDADRRAAPRSAEAAVRRDRARAEESTRRSVAHGFRVSRSAARRRRACAVVAQRAPRAGALRLAHPALAPRWAALIGTLERRLARRLVCAAGGASAAGPDRARAPAPRVAHHRAARRPATLARARQPARPREDAAPLRARHDRHVGARHGRLRLRHRSRRRRSSSRRSFRST